MSRATLARPGGTAGNQGCDSEIMADSRPPSVTPAAAAKPPRRAVLGGGLALLTTAALGPLGCAVAPPGTARFADGPFTLGVASGDPLADRVVLWTRLAPRPFADDGGLTAAAVPVRWQIAHDESFTRIAAEGTTLAEARFAHSVHVDAAGLEPERGYFYRFIALGTASPTGRTRTAPAPGARPDILRFANVGCQHYEAGFYTAYRHLAGEDLDLVVHTGDYIYEGATRRSNTRAVRRHPDHACMTLTDYRQRYALYKGDTDLQAAHAAHPFALVWDDHEVVNNWAGDRDGKGRGGEAFQARRAAAFQAWWEHMPLRRPPSGASGPQWAGMGIYRSLDFGALARINLCDTRQYRTPQPCGGEIAPPCDGATDANAHMLGAQQERWLQGRLRQSTATWNVIAQQVLMAEINRGRPKDGPRYNMDKWDGYRIPRRRLLGFLEDARIQNPVVLTGDIHRHMAAELRPDFSRPETPAVAAEFVNSSISSRGDGNPGSKTGARWQSANPHLHLMRDLRGYVRHSVTANQWRADFRVLDKVTIAGAPVRTSDSFVVEAGRARLLTA